MIKYKLMKLNLIILLLFLTAAGGAANGQQIYDVANIPAELMKNSTVVVRNEEQVLTR
jgi:hypothetical protein